VPQITEQRKLGQGLAKIGGTVKSHVNNTMQKLGVLLAQTAAICALRKGLIKM
jgi:DNA-binding NarL/FixJ family response regulator